MNEYLVAYKNDTLKRDDKLAQIEFVGQPVARFAPALTRVWAPV